MSETAPNAEAVAAPRALPALIKDHHVFVLNANREPIA